jgi:hypothetical protein
MRHALLVSIQFHFHQFESSNFFIAYGQIFGALKEDGKFWFGPHPTRDLENSTPMVPLG